MRYTDNVNKFLWHFLIPIFFLFFLSIRIYDYFNYNDSNLANINITEKLILNTASTEQLDGVILGGSNSLFSLSAEFFSEETKLNWRNLSLILEGYSDKNYWKFVSAAIPGNKREQLSFVIYSSVSPLRFDDILLRKNNSYDLVGKDFSFSLVPKLSLAMFLKKIIIERPEKNEGKVIPNNYGDLNFSNTKCSLDSKSLTFERNLNALEVNSWVMSQLDKLHELFPNATVYFVVPSQFSGSHYNSKRSDNSDKLLYESVQNYKETHNSKTFFIRQKEFPSIDMMCNAVNHANEKGRAWRSKNLMKAIQTADPSLSKI
jgi:hypothetical protein